MNLLQEPYQIETNCNLTFEEAFTDIFPRITWRQTISKGTFEDECIS